MFKTLPYLFVLFIFVQYGYSQTIIKSNEIIEIGEIDYGMDVYLIKDTYKAKSNNYDLYFNNDDENSLYIANMFAYWLDGALENSRNIHSHMILSLDLKSLQFETVGGGKYEPELRDQIIIQDGNTAVIDQKPVQLNWDIPTLEGYRGSSWIVSAIYLPTKNLIAGITHYQYSQSHYKNQRNLLLLWDSINGENIYQQQSTFVATRIISFSVEATKNEQYVYMRDMTQLLKTDEYNYLTPSVTLVDTETLEQIPADKDVAFTSNYQHYVTAVNNTPTLINTNTQEAIQHYDIDGKIMTAATFSPDYQKLYVATLSDDIYVFPSQLPTSNIDNWDKYQ